MALTRLRSTGLAATVWKRQAMAAAAGLGAPMSMSTTSTAASQTQTAGSAHHRGAAAAPSTALGPRRQVSLDVHRRHASTQAAVPDTYTASYAFFEALWEAGITHCFVNLGSDHPSIIEAMVKGQREAKGKFPRIITCPNEVSPHQTITARRSRWLTGTDGRHVHG